MKRFESAKKYVKELDASSEMAHAKLLREISPGSRVLEFGPASGVMTRELQKMGCSVSIVEIDPECYQSAMQYAVDGWLGDIESLQWQAAFEKACYDNILFVDVLEHLHQPDIVLKAAHALLKENGQVLISVPNIAYNGIIMDLMRNRFRYTPTGLLDTTHVHFFAFEQLQQLVRECGYEPVMQDCTYVEIGTSEVLSLYEQLPDAFADFLRHRPLGEAYQLLLTAEKHDFFQQNHSKLDDRLGGAAEYVRLSAILKEAPDGDIASMISKDALPDESNRSKLMQYLVRHADEIYVLNSEIARLSERLTRFARTNPAIADHADEIQVLTSQVRKETERVGQLTRENENLAAWGKALDAQVAERDATIHELNQRTEELSTWGKGLDAQVAERDATIHELNQRTEELSAWGKGLDARVAERDATIHELNQRTEELSAWGKGLDAQVAERDATIVELNKHTEELSAWGKRLDEQIANMTKERELAISKQRELEEQMRERDDILNQMMEKADLYNAWGTRLEEEIRKANAMAETVNAQREALRQLEARYQEEILSYKELIEAQKAEIQHHKGHVEALEHVVDARNEQIESQKAEIQHHKGHVEALEHVVDVRNETITALEGEKVQLNNQISYLKTKQDALMQREALLHEIEGSKAYRVTRMMQKASAVVLPVGSRRRHAVGKALRFARHPFRSVSGNRPKQPVISTSEKISDYKPMVFPVFDKPRVSIVIPVYNQFGYTYNCLKSILDHTKDVPYEVILGNDCSTDLTAKIKKIVSNIHVVTHKKNLRFLLNCNRAADSARGEFIYFLNNDTQVHPNWLSSLVALMDRDHSIGMCGSKLVYANGQLQEAGGIMWKDGSAWNYGRLQDPDAPEYSYVKDVDYISGAAIMIRTSLWKEIGGFDERYAPAYNEDSDLAFEVRKHGKRVVLQPDSVITHFEGISNGTDTSSGQKAYQVTNVQKFCEKWKEVLEREHFSNAENVFQARDRSSHKKTILVVDHYVPQFDKDAGSRTVFAYLKLFVQKGLNVKFIGDNFYRHEPYTHVLQQMGVEVLYGPWYAQHWDEWLRENGSHIDYVMLNRPHISVKYMASVRLFTNAKIFYYGHDLHFLRERRRYETTKDPSALAASNEWVEKEKSLMLQADETWYPSEVEVEEVHRIDPKIHVRSIPAYLFESSDPVPYDASKRQHVMFVGGFAHGPNVDAVKWLHDEIWPLVHQQCPSVKIFIIGSNPPDEIKRMNSKTFVVTGAVSDEELASYYHQCRMAIVPLRFGAGIKGKVVEAMYHRLPILTTKVGAEGISFTENSIAVRDQAPAFAGKLVKLYRDADTLNDMSAKYDQFIQNTYSYEFAAQTLAPEFDGWSAE